MIVGVFRSSLIAALILQGAFAFRADAAPTGWLIDVSPKGGWSASYNGEALMVPAADPLWSLKSADRIGADDLSALKETGQLHIAGADRKVVREKVEERSVFKDGVVFSEVIRKGCEISIVFTSAVWRIEEKLRLSDAPARIHRELHILNRGPKVLAFNGVSVRFPMVTNANCRLPARFFGYQQESLDGELSTWRRKPALDSAVNMDARRMRPGSILRSHYRVRVLLASVREGHSIVFFANPSKDACSPQFRRNEKDFSYETTSSACGWAEPGVEQVVLDDTYEYVSGDMDAALHVASPRLLADCGVKPPADRPDWVLDAAVYGFNALLGRGGWGVGGFQASKSIAARAESLGFNTTWCLPVEFGPCPYMPNDYFRKHPFYGSEADYREMVGEFHRRGIRFLQDVVPHGGGWRCWPKRPVDLASAVFTPDGNVLGYWGMDFADPRWREYMGSVADHYRALGVDGFRIDAPYGSFKPNWRHPSMTALPSVVNHLDIRQRYCDYDTNHWEKTLAAHGGKLPPLDYPRASMAQCWGGVQMVGAIREAARKGNSEGAVLAEVFGLPFPCCSDLLFDMTSPYLSFRLINLSAADFVRGYSRWMDERQCVTPADAVLLRYTACHDQRYATYFLGAAPYRAMLASHYFVRGAPLVFNPDERGHGSFLRSLNNLRAARTELRRGEADYLGVRPSDARVFAVRRVLKGVSGVGLVNFAEESVSFTLSGGGLPLSREYRMGAWEVMYLDGETGSEIRLDGQTFSRALMATEHKLRGIAEVVDFYAYNRWRVKTIDGGLDDFTEEDAVRDRAFGAVAGLSTSWRGWGGVAAWDSLRQPLDPKDPWIEFSNDRGERVVVRPEEYPTSDFAIVEKMDGKAGLRLIVRPRANARDVASSSAIPRLSMGRFGYRVENGAYDITLNRMGGGIRSWKDAAGKELVCAGDMVALDAQGRGWGVAGWDLDTEVAFRRENGALVVVFFSYLRDSRGKGCRPVESAVEYRFDMTPQVRVRAMMRPLEVIRPPLKSLSYRWTGPQGEQSVELAERTELLLPAIRQAKAFSLKGGALCGLVENDSEFDPKPIGTDGDFSFAGGFSGADGVFHFAPLVFGPGGNSRWYFQFYGHFVQDPKASNGVAFEVRQPEGRLVTWLGERLAPGKYRLEVRLRGTDLRRYDGPRSLDFIRQGHLPPPIHLTFKATDEKGGAVHFARIFDAPENFDYTLVTHGFTLKKSVLAPRAEIAVGCEVEGRVYLDSCRLVPVE